jgi:hypothetical protein
MHLEKFHEANGLFIKAGDYGGDNHAVNLIAKGLSIVTVELIHMANDIQVLKARTAPTVEQEPD